MGKLVQNNKAIIYALKRFPVTDYIKDADEIKENLVGDRNDKRNLLLISVHSLDKEEIKNSIKGEYLVEGLDKGDINRVLDSLTGLSNLEKALKDFDGKKFGKKEILQDFLSDYSGEKYLVNGEKFSRLVSHGTYHNGHFYSENSGRSDVEDVIETLACTNGPLSRKFDQFSFLSHFYDGALGQHNSHNYSEEDRAVYQKFFNAKNMEEADTVLKPVNPLAWKYLKESLAYDGITTLPQIKDRIKEFEENFFPDEFERAKVSIVQTRDWLNSLKD